MARHVQKFAEVGIDSRPREDRRHRGQATDTLMGYLPPVGWADVATRQDLDSRFDSLRTEVDTKIKATEDRITAALRKELHTQFYWLVTIMILLFSIFTAVIELAD